jgi:hypothetical protein
MKQNYNIAKENRNLFFLFLYLFEIIKILN